MASNTTKQEKRVTVLLPQVLAEAAASAAAAEYCSESDIIRRALAKDLRLLGLLADEARS
jgi:Arc/MetJ-type ribon-helix-helix transcriptional regulator